MKKIIVTITILLATGSLAFADKSPEQLLNKFENKYLEIPTDKVYPASFDATLSDFFSEDATFRDITSADSRKGSSVLGTRFLITGTATRHVKIPRKTIEEAYDYAFKNTRIVNKAQLVKALDLIDKIDERSRTPGEFARELAGLAGSVVSHIFPVAAPFVGAATGIMGAWDIKNNSAGENINWAVSSTLSGTEASIVSLAMFEEAGAKGQHQWMGNVGEPVIKKSTEGLRSGIGAFGNVLEAVSFIETYRKWDKMEKAKWATRIGKTWLAPIAEFAELMNEYIRKKTYSDAEWTISIKGQYSSPFDFRGVVCYQTWTIDMELNKMWPEDNSRESINKFNNQVDGVYVGTMNASGAYNLTKYDSQYIKEDYPDGTAIMNDNTRERANIWSYDQRKGAIQVTDRSKASKCYLTIEKPIVIDINSGSMSMTAYGAVGEWGKYQNEMLGPEPQTTLDLKLQFFKLFECKGGMEGTVFEFYDGDKIRIGLTSMVTPHYGDDFGDALIGAMTLLNDYEEHDINSLGLVAEPSGSITIDVSQDVSF